VDDHEQAGDLRKTKGKKSIGLTCMTGEHVVHIEKHRSSFLEGYAMLQDVRPRFFFVPLEKSPKIVVAMGRSTLYR